MTGAADGFAGFWTETIFSGPWPSGPAWFLGVLLAFDLIVVLIHPLFHGRDVNWADRLMTRPLACFGLLVVISALAYLPLLVLFGPAHWFSFGPFAVQASRIGLYGAWFLIGVAAGHLGLDHFLVVLGRPLQRRWAAWSLLAVLSFIALVAAEVWRSSLLGSALMLFCVSATFAWFAIFLRFLKRTSVLFDSLGANAYGIYILHYPAVIWMQYALLDARLGAIIKAALVFAVALSVSWGNAMMLRRLPGGARVL